MKISNV